VTGSLKDKRWSALVLPCMGAVFAGVAAIVGTRLRPTQAARAAEAAQVQA